MGLGEMHPEDQREEVVGLIDFPQKAARAYNAALYCILGFQFFGEQKSCDPESFPC